MEKKNASLSFKNLTWFHIDIWFALWFYSFQVANFVKRLLKVSLIAALNGLLSLGNAWIYFKTHPKEVITGDVGYFIKAVAKAF